MAQFLHHKRIGTKGVYIMKLKGFSLIELMIVIAIIGILASIAVPAYQNYIYRARTSELMSLGNGASTAINSYIQEQGQAGTPNCPSTAFGATGTQYVPPAQTNNVTSIVVTSACVVQITPNTTTTGSFKSIAATAPYITLTPTINADGSIAWACHSNPGAFGTGGSKYAPSTCQ